MSSLADTRRFSRQSKSVSIFLIISIATFVGHVFHKFRGTAFLGWPSGDTFSGRRWSAQKGSGCFTGPRTKKCPLMSSALQIVIQLQGNKPNRCKSRKSFLASLLCLQLFYVIQMPKVSVGMEWTLTRGLVRIWMCGRFGSVPEHEFRIVRGLSRNPPHGLEECDHTFPDNSSETGV